MAVVALSAQQGGDAPVRATIGDVAWIAGTWVGGNDTLSIEERWTPPAGRAMLAVSRTVKGDRMVSFEYLRIVERGETLVYIAQPNGRPPTEFTLTRIERDQVSFENPTHDFPKSIRYAKRPDGTLEATISGEGGTKARSFLFRPAKLDH